MICITNNSLVIERDIPNVKIVLGDTLAVLKSAKNEILDGYKLITHPLTSNIRPEISPYKTVLLSSMKSVADSESLKIINYSISYAENLMKNQVKEIEWDQQSLEDFKFIDLDIICNILGIRM